MGPAWMEHDKEDIVGFLQTLAIPWRHNRDTWRNKDHSREGETVQKQASGSEFKLDRDAKTDARWNEMAFLWFQMLDSLLVLCKPTGILLLGSEPSSLQYRNSVCFEERESMTWRQVA